MMQTRATACRVAEGGYGTPWLSLQQGALCIPTVTEGAAIRRPFELFGDVNVLVQRLVVLFEARNLYVVWCGVVMLMCWFNDS